MSSVPNDPNVPTSFFNVVVKFAKPPVVSKPSSGAMYY